MQEDNFIPEIFNYCDRWCERCTFTSRCRSYESTSKLLPEQLDMNNKAFWENIADNFAKAFVLLEKAAEKFGIEISPLTEKEEAAYRKQEEDINAVIKKHALVKLCRKYETLMIPFINDADPHVNKTRELVSHLHFGITNEENVVHTVANIGDCYDILNWYLFLIEAKLRRALHGLLENEEDDGYSKDSDGSAKIALISIEKSMAALSRLYEILPETEDNVLMALSVLQQLQVKAKKTFPVAEKFKRPGFDDCETLLQ